MYSLVLLKRMLRKMYKRVRGLVEWFKFRKIFQKKKKIDVEFIPVIKPFQKIYLNKRRKKVILYGY